MSKNVENRPNLNELMHQIMRVTELFGDERNNYVLANSGPSKHGNRQGQKATNRNVHHSQAGPSTSRQHGEKHQEKQVKEKKTRRRERSNKTVSKQNEEFAKGTTKFSTEPSVNKVEIKSPARIRRAQNAPVVAPVPNQIEIKYYTIKAMKNHKSQLIRKRNTKFKYINLKTFISASLGASRTCIFKTNIFNLTSTLSKLKLKDTLTKSERRKYPSSACLLLQQKEEPNQTPKKLKKPKKKLKPKEDETAQFPEYFSQDQALDGLKKEELVKGFIRINPKNPSNSYVNNKDTSVSDYYITSIVDRNRAMEGDEVVLKLKPQNEWTDGKKTASVVYIQNMINPRTTVGTLKALERKNSEYAVFYPKDKRIPTIRIPTVSWPNGFKSNPKQFKKIIFLAKILEWNHPSYATGIILEELGTSGDLRVETVAILKEFYLDVTPFSPDMAKYLPTSKGIPEEECTYREDIRDQCVFTIDPLTARDLDDAVSVKELPNGNYEIGVHISDVAYYLEEGTELDQIVSKKATTIYLVNNVYHMLPVELCLHCSLLPGQDKMTFSVFWELNEKGEIFSTRFARTLMNSCTQLAYEHAQMMIEDPERDFTENELPSIHNGYTSRDLSRTVNTLQKIAVNLRESRIRNGALRIDQVKLLFSLHPVTGEPTDFRVYENKESHRLIEEFMLLANISVAKKIVERFPDLAFLRCHEPPKTTMLVDLQKSLETCGLHIDITSSGGINAGLKKYITDDFAGKCRGAVLNHLFAKPMTRARYFCASTADSEDEFRHYALSTPIYTHFTSPIRRYADIMVHRLLAASLDYSEEPEWDVDYVSSIAANCNAQKYNAKRAGEASMDLYLAHYIEQNQPYVQDCVVVDVKERSFDAIILNTGSIVRIYQNTCEGSAKWKVETIPTPRKTGKSENQEEKLAKEHEKKVLTLNVTFPQNKQHEEVSMIIAIFSLVKVKLQRKPNTYKLDATLLRPIRQ